MTSAYAVYNTKQSEALEGQLELFRKNMAEQAEINNLELKCRLDEIFKNFDRKLLSALDQVNGMNSLFFYFLKLV